MPGATRRETTELTPRRPRPVSLSLVALALLAAEGPCGTTTPQPFDEELLANGGFETGDFAPWVVEAGSCEIDTSPLGIPPLERHPVTPRLRQHQVHQAIPIQVTHRGN